MSSTFPDDGTSLVIDSGKPGPTLLVLGGVHGDETCGIEVVRAILTKTFAPVVPRGKLIVALANPFAIARGKRFVRCNMNRAFLPGVVCECDECGRARTLKVLLDQADVLLDIHASYTPASEPFLICEQNALPYVGAMPIGKVCFGFDDVQPGGTDYYVNARGKVGMCLECGYLADPRSTDIAFGCLSALLAALGEVPASDAIRPPPFFRAAFQYVSRENFVLRAPLADFEGVAADQLLGTDGGSDVRSPRDGAVLFAVDRAGAGEESFVFLDTNVSASTH